MQELTNKEMAEIDKYEKFLKRRELVAKHAGLITFTAIIIALLGIGILIVLAS